ncbi:MAG: hypothetical protein K2F81_07875, partial [Ruminococcus sp.]|nr:hypothetical protein [Ruminococcus sp.]
MSEIKRLQTAYNLKKYVAIALCAALLCGCRNLSEVSSQGSFAVQTSVASPTETTAAIQTETSAVTDVSSVPPKTVMSVHEFELITAHSVRITGGLENVKKVNIYVCETSPENNGTVYQRLVFSSDLSDIQPSESGYEIRFDPDNYMEEITYEADNSDIKTEYYAKGVRLGFSDGNSEIISACIPIEVHIETGVVNQYDAQLRGDTACGAASGTLLLQSVLP